MDVFSIIIGIFCTTLFFIIGIVVVWIVIMLHNMKFNRIVRINNRTAGKDTVEWYKARLMKHKTLGDVYHVPALKKEDRHYIPFTGKANEFPTNKNKTMYVPLTFYNGTYAPESYEHNETKKVDVIEKRYGELTESEYLALDVKEREENRNKYKVSFHKVSKEIQCPIIKPTKYSMRQFNLDMDTSIKDDFFLNPSWFERYGGLVIAGGIVVMGAAVAIIMIVFAYQWGVDVSQQTPAWVGPLIDGLTNGGAGGAAPPTESI